MKFWVFLWLLLCLVSKSLRGDSCSNGSSCPGGIKTLNTFNVRHICVSTVVDLIVFCLNTQVEVSGTLLAINVPPMIPVSC